MEKQYIQILDLISDDVNDKFVITIYGKSKESENVVLNVIDFEPFFYVRVPPGWNQHTANGFFKNLKFNDKKFTTDSDETEFDIKMEYEKNKYYNFYIYDDKKYDFLKFSFKSYDMMRKMIYKVRKFYEECKTDVDPDKKSFHALNGEDGEFRFDANLYESNIHPLLRFIHDRNIQPSGWIEFTYSKSNIVKEKKQIYNCEKQYDDIPYESINYHEYDEISKYVIASFDIECDSSHGDFPSAKKDFKKLSMYIVEEYLSGTRPDSGSLYTFIKDILIKSIPQDGIIKKYDEDHITYVINGPLKEESIIKAFLDENEDGDIDIGDKSYDMNKKFKELQTALKNDKRNDAIDILNRKKNKPGILSNLKNDKGEKLKVMGDPIIQIGTVFYTYGKPDSYDRHILVIGPQPNMKKKEICSDLDKIEVTRYKSEKGLLEGWVELMEGKNPDYITGYNIFGFDFDYIIGRVSELYECKPECKFNMFSKSMDHCYNCPTNKFYNLGRLFKNDFNIYKNNKCKRCKSIVKKLGGGNDKEDESTYSHDTLKYIHMDGRIIFDVQNEVKKGYPLDSYKLDNVAANFMRGKIKSIRNLYNEDVNNYLIFINTDRTGNLKNGDYISFNVKNNYGDMKYDNGHKFMILNIYHDEKKIILKSDKALVISKILNLETNDILYSEWCLNKDDISPQELFDKHKWGTGEDRGMIAKYCIMDCELCIHLLLMLDFIPNNIGMSNVCKVPQPYIFLRGQGIKVQSIVTKFAHENKYKIPTLMGYDEELSDNSGFEGAIVLDPKPGLYLDDPISVVDYASLYPSSIIEKNISHDTYLGDYKDIKDKLDEKGYIEGIDYNRIQYDNYEYIQKEGTQVIEKINTNEVMDCVFLSEHNEKVEKKKGIIPMVVGELLSARSATKKRLKLEKDENKKKVLDGFQLAYKLTANSVYGQLGAKTSCLSFKKVAACTTAVGRQKIIDAKKYAYDWALSPYNNMIYNPLKEKYNEQEYIEYYENIVKLDEDNLLTDKKVKIFNGEEKNHRELECEKYKLLDVIYGDTDSIFIKFSRKTTKDNELTKSEAVDHCIQCGLKAGEYITSMLKRDNWPKDKPGYPQDLEYEKTFYPFILISKKRYTGEKYEFSSKEIPKRTSMGLVTKRRDNAPIVKYVFGNMVNRLMSNTRVEDVIKWLNQTLNRIVNGKEHISMFVISKTLNSYYKNPQSIAHKVLADRMGQRDPGNKPKANDRIPYAYIIIDETKWQDPKLGYYKSGKNKGKAKSHKILQGERIEHVDYITDNPNVKLDYKLYISNQIMNPVKQLLDVAIDPEETMKIFNSYLQ
tara:strand:+ start:3204 stop:7145 length:3942 start_codon:yes stop_codon:yes gene_type:complete